MIRCLYSGHICLLRILRAFRSSPVFVVVSLVINETYVESRRAVSVRVLLRFPYDVRMMFRRRSYEKHEFSCPGYLTLGGRECFAFAFGDDIKYARNDHVNNEYFGFLENIVFAREFPLLSNVIFVRDIIARSERLLVASGCPPYS